MPICRVPRLSSKLSRASIDVEENEEPEIRQRLGLTANKEKRNRAEDIKSYLDKEGMPRKKLMCSRSECVCAGNEETRREK